jgi:hypothetical protein
MRTPEQSEAERTGRAWCPDCESAHSITSAAAAIVPIFIDVAPAMTKTIPVITTGAAACGLSTTFLIASLISSATLRPTARPPCAARQALPCRSQSQMLARNHKPSGHNGKEIAKYFVPAIEIRDFVPVEFRAQVPIK